LVAGFECDRALKLSRKILGLKADIVAKRFVSKNMVVLTLLAPEIAELAKPGQFVQVRLGEARSAAILPRPFSIYDAHTSQGSIEILVSPVGLVTKRLFELDAGGSLVCLGPLGMPVELPSSGSVCLVSGGAGVAPMPFIAKEALAHGLEVIWVHGARSADFASTEYLGGQVFLSTDDGSKGFKGSVVELVTEKFIDGDAVFACGPIHMLAQLSKVRPHAYVSIETYMACGFGVCLGCVIPLVDGSLTRTCVEGTFFRSDVVDWITLLRELT